MTGMRVAVQERAGRSIKQLAKSEPLKLEKCGSVECFTCKTGKGSCEKSRIGYEEICETCLLAGKKVKYLGESGRNGYTRGAEHQAALRLENEENPLWKHCMLEHDSVWADFSMRVCGIFHSCLVRQVNEAVRIETC